MKFCKRFFPVVLSTILVLALLSGCGGSAPADKLTTQGLVKFMNSTMASIGRNITAYNTEEMEQKASVLLTIAQKNYKAEKNSNVLALLTSDEALQAAGIDSKNDTYHINISVNPDYIGTVPSEQRQYYVVDSFSRNPKIIGADRLYTKNTINIGIVFGKLGQTEYIIMLQDGNN